MEKFYSSEIGTRKDGTKIVRNHFVNETNVNHLANAQSHFTKHEKLVAKLNYKKNK